MHSDTNTTIEMLKRALREFRDERDWVQFHDPKNLAEAISIEASELLELFLWKEAKEAVRAVKSDPRLRIALGDELADVICFSLSLANASDIDVTQIVMNKIEKNKLKYPVSNAKGTSAKYDKL